LVNEVVPAANLIARAEAVLKQIFSNAPIAVKYSLEAVNKGLETSQAEGFALEASFFGLCAGTEDKKEGTSAFLAKRTAKFQGQSTHIIQERNQWQVTTFFPDSKSRTSRPSLRLPAPQ